MGIGTQVIAAARAVERDESVEAATLLAVALVETDGVGFATVGGRPVPLIRFEGHYFDRLLEGEARIAARAAGLAHPRAGAVRNPAGQAGRWALLDKASAIDAEAAFASTSWGLAQVMGAHHRTLGFASAAELAACAKASMEGQLVLAARFLKANGLSALLGSGERVAFARRYNGPAHARNRYAEKIGAAYERARAALGAQTPLRAGAEGDAVRGLQKALAVAGIPVAVDGRFGPLTLRAVLAFQAEARLVADGIAGPATLKALGLAAPGSVGPAGGTG